MCQGQVAGKQRSSYQNRIILESRVHAAPHQVAPPPWSSTSNLVFAGLLFRVSFSPSHLQIISTYSPFLTSLPPISEDKAHIPCQSSFVTPHFSSPLRTSQSTDHPSPGPSSPQLLLLLSPQPIKALLC